MAAAEARAAWQRTANRCFVQEDAKRAPKLACCQSSSSTSKQVEAEGPGTNIDGPQTAGAGFRPLNRNPSYSNLPPDTRWWILMQPCYLYQKGLACEYSNALDSDETLQSEVMNSTTYKMTKVGLQKQDAAHAGGNKNRVSEVRKLDVKAICGKNMEELHELDVMTYGYEMVDMDHVDYSDAKQPNETFDSEYTWIGSENTEPWWRMTDRDELISFVAQRSFEHVENCDLPPPQKLCHRKHPHAHTRYSGGEEILGTSMDWKSQASGDANQMAPPRKLNPCQGSYHETEEIPAQRDRLLVVLKSPSLVGHRNRGLRFASSGLSYRSVPGQGSTDLGRPHDRQRDMTEKELSHHGSAKHFSFGTVHNELKETQPNYESDYTKKQLMTALCHSQTRAREAEKAAKQAHAEKEHILTLFFRQASQLFAYKQWFQMLYIQIKKNDPQNSALFPMGLPWMSRKGRKLKKSCLHRSPKGKRVKREQPSHGIMKYGVPFALGLGLVAVGAGLLLGWTVGWMLPPF